MSQAKKTEVYEVRVTALEGYHLALTPVLSRKHVRKHPAYECLNDDCHWDFRVRRPRGPVAEHGVQVTCPKCGSLYVEWLSFGVAPIDVYLDTDEELGLVHDGKVV